MTYADLPALMTRMTGDEKHSAAEHCRAAGLDAEGIARNIRSFLV